MSEIKVTSAEVVPSGSLRESLSLASLLTHSFLGVHSLAVDASPSPCPPMAFPSRPSPRVSFLRSPLLLL